MAILVLNRLDSQSVKFPEWLNEKPILIVDKKVATGFDPSHYDEIIEIEEYEQSGRVESEAIRISSQKKVSKIVAISEVDLIRASRLRDFLGISSNTEIEYKLFRDKVAMKRHASASGLRVPKFVPIDSPCDLFRAAKVVGLPFFLKPTLYGGGVGAGIITNLNEVEGAAAVSYLKPDLSHPRIAEELIQGEMAHCDGICINNKIQWSRTSKYIVGCLAFKTGELHGGYLLETGNSIHDLCNRSIQKFLDGLKSKLSFAFHAEFFIANEDVIFCEIAARPGGSRIRDMLVQQGVDLFETHVKLQAGLTKDLRLPPSTANGLAAYLVLPPKLGILESVPNHPPPELGITRYFRKFEPGRIWFLRSIAGTKSRPVL